jgi:subtilisin-like proprotein convertase family protein/subtilisin family serine protease
VVAYEIAAANAGLSRAEWIAARSVGAGRTVEFGKQIVLAVKSPLDLKTILNQRGTALRLIRQVNETAALLEASDAWAALTEAEALAKIPGVAVAYPIMRRNFRRQGPYARPPNDTYFNQQWHLENRSADGTPMGADLNIRSAWPLTAGAGIIVAVSDGGIELTHPDLANRGANLLHYNFALSQSNGLPANAAEKHGTEVAGLILAEAGNHRGIAGVAPQARLASWVIITPNGNFVDEVKLAAMYEYAAHVVAIQNHSWSFSETQLNGPTYLEQLSLANALTQGRGGRGIIMVRPAGNFRVSPPPYGVSANDDGYLNDPRTIGVAAVRKDGRVTSYSNPGTCLLVAAPGGDFAAGYPGVPSTDLTGSKGANTNAAGWPTNDFSDYCLGDSSLEGTSFTTAQISGLAALILSANSNLTSRDVQQLMLLSARHFDLADPHLKTNGAGLRVSQNIGFGVPDAGLAVRLAKSWSNRPPLQILSCAVSNAIPIPEHALRLKLTGSNLPPNLASLMAWPANLGPRADKPTARLPLVHITNAALIATQNLTNQAVLLPNTGRAFEPDIMAAARAGAALVIYYHTNGNERMTMPVSDYCPLPAAMISQVDGLALIGLLQTNVALTARLEMEAAMVSLTVTNTMVCEHVGLRIQTDHARRGDLRITLQSPMGTVSELQRRNSDQNPGPSDWTFYSTHHFYETSAGTWTLQVSDEVTGNTGSVWSAELIIRGVGMADTNRNGLADGWEQARLHTANGDPQADADYDGFNNAVEQILGTDPLALNEPLKLDLAVFNDNYLRLSWPGATNVLYQIFSSESVTQPLILFGAGQGNFPEAEVFLLATNTARFFKVK